MSRPFEDCLLSMQWRQLLEIATEKLKTKHI